MVNKSSRKDNSSKNHFQPLKLNPKWFHTKFFFKLSWCRYIDMLSVFYLSWNMLLKGFNCNIGKTKFWFGHIFVWFCFCCNCQIYLLVLCNKQNGENKDYWENKTCLLKNKATHKNTNKTWTICPKSSGVFKQNIQNDSYNKILVVTCTSNES